MQEILQELKELWSKEEGMSLVYRDERGFLYVAHTVGEGGAGRRHRESGRVLGLAVDRLRAKDDRWDTTGAGESVVGTEQGTTRHAEGAGRARDGAIGGRPVGRREGARRAWWAWSRAHGKLLGANGRALGGRAAGCRRGACRPPGGHVVRCWEGAREGTRKACWRAPGGRQAPGGWAHGKALGNHTEGVGRARARRLEGGRRVLGGLM